MNSYEWFIKEFKEYSTIDLSLYKEAQMKRRIEGYITKHINEVNYNVFLNEIKKNNELCKNFLEFITINVTEFFRNYPMWETLRTLIIPKIIKNNELKVWSAGCSTGEEAYTIAMILKEFYPNLKFEILATDIDKRVLEMAQNGIYNINSMKSVPQELKFKYFDKVNDTPDNKNMYKIKEFLKENVSFKHHNMLYDEFPKNLDLIICRNVVIYFKEETKSSLYEKFFLSLNNNSCLFVGNTEQILNHKELGFKINNTFFFEKI